MSMLSHCFFEGLRLSLNEVDFRLLPARNSPGSAGKWRMVAKTPSPPYSSERLQTFGVEQLE